MQDVGSDDSMPSLDYVVEVSARGGAWDKPMHPLDQDVSNPMFVGGDMQGRLPSTDTTSDDSMPLLDCFGAESVGMGAAPMAATIKVQAAERHLVSGGDEVDVPASCDDELSGVARSHILVSDVF